MAYKLEEEKRAQAQEQKSKQDSIRINTQNVPTAIKNAQNGKATQSDLTALELGLKDKKTILECAGALSTLASAGNSLSGQALDILISGLKSPLLANSALEEAYLNSAYSAIRWNSAKLFNEARIDTLIGMLKLPATKKRAIYVLNSLGESNCVAKFSENQKNYLIENYESSCANLLLAFVRNDPAAYFEKTLGAWSRSIYAGNPHAGEVSSGIYHLAEEMPNYSPKKLLSVLSKGLAIPAFSGGCAGGMACMAGFSMNSWQVPSAEANLKLFEKKHVDLLVKAMFSGGSDITFPCAEALLALSEKRSDLFSREHVLEIFSVFDEAFLRGWQVKNASQSLANLAKTRPELFQAGDPPRLIKQLFDSWTAAGCALAIENLSSTNPKLILPHKKAIQKELGEIDKRLQAGELMQLDAEEIKKSLQNALKTL